jgi:hypothetical protein
MATVENQEHSTSDLEEVAPSAKLTRNRHPPRHSLHSQAIP